MINRVIIGGSVITVKGKKEATYVYLSNKYKFMDKYTKEVRHIESKHWIRFDGYVAKRAYSQILTNDYILVEGKLSYTYNKLDKKNKIGLVLGLSFSFEKIIPIKMTNQDYQNYLEVL